MKPAYQSTEFWLVPAAWAAMEASPQIAWPIAVAYVAFALGRSLVKAPGPARRSSCEGLAHRGGPGPASLTSCKLPERAGAHAGAARP